MLALEVSDTSQVAEARRQVCAAASAAGFGEARAALVGLAVTELSTNLIKHAGGGQLLASAEDDWLDLLALDRGPGMTDIDTCMGDGHSSAGTRGAGLGAVRRLAQHFEVASWPGRGTAVLAAIARDRAGEADLRPPVWNLSIAMPGESVSGDDWSARVDSAGITVLVVDGLGHGTQAAVAANAAVRQFQQHSTESPAGILDAVHRALRSTRGGAAAVARVDRRSATVTFAGLGNIAACVIDATGGMRRMVSLNGIAGHNARKIQAFEYPCGDGLLVMHSDGVATSWTLDRYPGLMHAHPLLFAGVLYRDFARPRDDVTIVVARLQRP